MRKIVVFAWLACAVEAHAQSVEIEMAELKRLAEQCESSISASRCDVTSACSAFQRYYGSIMPDGAPAYYDLHARNKTMNFGNGKQVSDAVTAATRANKVVKKCMPVQS